MSLFNFFFWFTGFLCLWWAGATLCCLALAAPCGGLSCCGAQALRMLRLQYLRLLGWVAPWFVESSQTRDWTSVPALAGGFLPAAPTGKSLNNSHPDWPWHTRLHECSFQHARYALFHRNPLTASVCTLNALESTEKNILLLYVQQNRRRREREFSFYFPFPF